MKVPLYYIIMNRLYKIPGTSNIDQEQNSYPYTDENFWPTFQEDLKNFHMILNLIVQHKVFIMFFLKQ